MEKVKKIVLIGASGFVGSALLNEAFCEIVFEKAADTVCCGYNEKFFIKTYI